MSCEPVLTFAQCSPPTNLSSKQGDIIFKPVANYPVYEIVSDGSTTPVSTPTSVDKFGNYHYAYSGTAANWYSLPIVRGSVVKVRVLCLSEYWYSYPTETNWQHYKNDPSKFSQYSNSIIVR